MFGRESKRAEKRPSTPAAASAAPVTPTARIETVIGPNAHFRGDLISEGGIRIDGIFEGNLETAGNLVIGESAKVIAEIRANNISISGAVKGNIIGNRVEVLETGRVWGDLTVNSLLVSEGAYLRGQTTMHADIEPPLIEPPKPRTAPSASATIPAPGTIVDVEPERREEAI
ncbi:MAG: polymer-forming cytoskeletal protein [Anaerolineae bacterium]|nr:polymer-forming cytoskeletal protein [Anaerolineae bacterium]MDW8069030.1 polymer-forming cytoskeletal protein [Anaerolineae bacterium]